MHGGGRIAWLWALSPLVVGVVLVLLLAEFKLIEFHFSIHDVDTFILFSGLLATTLISFAVLVRSAIRRMQRETESRLRAAFAEDRIRFIRRLDHEIKNPLMGIQTALDNLSQESDVVRRQAIRRSILEQIDRMARLVADLRRIGDIEQNPIERLPVDAVALLHDAFHLAAEDDLAADRKLFLDVPANLPTITGDADLLLLAVHNVLVNALKYTRPGDRIRLAARAEEDCLEVAVNDTGPGIEPDDLPYVTDELYRSPRVKDIAGSGIGLAMVRRIADLHNGRVKLDSISGRGTTVVLSLPLAGHAHRATPGSSATAWFRRVSDR